MKVISTLALALLLLLAPAVHAAKKELPKTIAGITLGDSVDRYARLCDMDMVSTIPDTPFLSEVRLDPDAVPGIRGGSLTYANTTEDRRLVRIKLKFHDRKQDLFDQLLARYKRQFGDPDNYAGDSFHNVIAWQWKFHKDGEMVDLILMWSREPDMRPGVSIKMTLESLVKEEFRRFKMRRDKRDQDNDDGPSAIKDLGEFVPR